MSRVLTVTNDPRRVPRFARWWRRGLYPGPDGYVCRTQIDPSWDERTPWWSHIDYYDNADHWYFPYAARTSIEFDTEDIGFPLVATLINRDRHYLDMLMDQSPGPNWQELTWPGQHTHPDDRKSRSIS